MVHGLFLTPGHQHLRGAVPQGATWGALHHQLGVAPQILRREGHIVRESVQQVVRGGDGLWQWSNIPCQTEIDHSDMRVGTTGSTLGRRPCTTAIVQCCKMGDSDPFCQTQTRAADAHVVRMQLGKKILPAQLAYFAKRSVNSLGPCAPGTWLLHSAVLLLQMLQTNKQLPDFQYTGIPTVHKNTLRRNLRIRLNRRPVGYPAVACRVPTIPRYSPRPSLHANH